MVTETASVCGRDHRYNGWSNYETWVVNLWLDNEESTQRHCESMAWDEYSMAEATSYASRDEMAVIGLADLLKAFVVDNEAPDLGATMYADLLSGAMSEVHWGEIAEHYIADLDKSDFDNETDED